MFDTYSALGWVIFAAALFVLEAFTVQFICVWFAFGAAIAIIPALMGAPSWVQLLVFLLSSILFLFAIRPVLKNRLHPGKQPTNADMVIGQTGLVLDEIDNLRDTGRVSAMGLTWTARTEEDEVVPAESKVLVKRIEGVKLIVTPISSQE